MRTKILSLLLLAFSSLVGVNAQMQQVYNAISDSVQQIKFSGDSLYIRGEGKSLAGVTDTSLIYDIVADTALFLRTSIIEGDSLLAVAVAGKQDTITAGNGISKPSIDQEIISLSINDDIKTSLKSFVGNYNATSFSGVDVDEDRGLAIFAPYFYNSVVVYSYLEDKIILEAAHGFSGGATFSGVAIDVNEGVAILSPYTCPYYVRYDYINNQFLPLLSHNKGASAFSGVDVDEDRGLAIFSPFNSSSYIVYSYIDNIVLSSLSHAYSTFAFWGVATDKERGLALYAPYRATHFVCYDYVNNVIDKIIPSNYGTNAFWGVAADKGRGLAVYAPSSSSFIVVIDYIQGDILFNTPKGYTNNNTFSGIVLDESKGLAFLGARNATDYNQYDYINGVILDKIPVNMGSSEIFQGIGIDKKRKVVTNAPGNSQAIVSYSYDLPIYNYFTTPRYSSQIPISEDNATTVKQQLEAVDIEKLSVDDFKLINADDVVAPATGQKGLVFYRDGFYRIVDTKTEGAPVVDNLTASTSANKPLSTGSVYIVEWDNVLDNSASFSLESDGRRIRVDQPVKEGNYIGFARMQIACVGKNTAYPITVTLEAYKQGAPTGNSISRTFTSDNTLSFDLNARNQLPLDSADLIEFRLIISGQLQNPDQFYIKSGAFVQLENYADNSFSEKIPAAYIEKNEIQLKRITTVPVTTTSSVIAWSDFNDQQLGDLFEWSPSTPNTVRVKEKARINISFSAQCNKLSGSPVVEVRVYVNNVSKQNFIRQQELSSSTITSIVSMGGGSFAVEKDDEISVYIRNVGTGSLELVNTPDHVSSLLTISRF